MNEKARIKLDKRQVKRDEIVEVRTMMPLQMKVEGTPPNSTEVRVRPKNVSCKVAGIEVFAAEIGASIATTAYFAFKFRARESGRVEVLWKMESEPDFPLPEYVTVI